MRKKTLDDKELRFGFGANWADYIKTNYSEERLEISRKHLLKFLKSEDLKDRAFIDIGCGSGLHSLAAFQSGAKKIVSLDYDINSVNTTKYLHEQAGSPDNWEIHQGSVLDRIFLQSLGEFDVVYSWGVLHHTGDMWNAIANAASTLKSDGVYYIALYTADLYVNQTPEFWLKVKKTYNQSGYVIRRIMEFTYATKTLFIPSLLRGTNILQYMRDYKQSRGMSYWHDVKDWLGGWPMEFAGIKETKDFCANRLELELLNINAGEANTEYLFRKKGVSNYWDTVLQGRQLHVHGKPFKHVRGFAWGIDLPQWDDLADNKEHPKRSSLMLYEDNVPIGFAHADLDHIAAHGKGRYSHTGARLVFSTTDNTDPNTNGRQYSYCMDMLTGY